MSELNDFIDGQRAANNDKECPFDANRAFKTGYEAEHMLRRYRENAK